MARWPRARAYEEFCTRLLDIVVPLVPVVKPQSAFFEACGPEGLAVLQRLLRLARDHGLITILDGKRNDIASTAEAYADAAFGGVRIDGTTHAVWDSDALTVNPYLRRDSLEPFLASARRSQRGVSVSFAPATWCLNTVSGLQRRTLVPARCRPSALDARNPGCGRRRSVALRTRASCCGAGPIAGSPMLTRLRRQAHGADTAAAFREDARGHR